VSNTTFDSTVATTINVKFRKEFEE